MERESEEFQELGRDEIGDVVEDAFEGVKHQKPFRWPTVAERWEKGEVGIHYHVRGHYVGEDKSRYYCAVFERTKTDFVPEVNTGDGVFSTEGKTVVHCSNKGQDPVSVETSEFIEDSERVSLDVPAVVRLQTLDKCLRSGGMSWTLMSPLLPVGSPVFFLLSK